MDLVYEFTYQAQLKPPVGVGPGPFGDRRVFEVIEGRFEGERLNGRILSGGGEWFLVGADGFGRIDVRIQMETDDGAFIYAQYFGLLELNDAVQGFISGRREETGFADQYFRIAPRLESGDPRYAWVNQTVFVAEGRGFPGYGVEYRVFRVD
jgi:hypothetical protein